MSHPTTTMREPIGNEDVEIDELMVPIIEQLWADGIHTHACCQGDPGETGHKMGYIAFDDVFHLGRFQQKFWGCSDRTLQRVEHWHWCLGTQEFVDREGEWYRDFFSCVDFPYEDLELMYQVVRNETVNERRHRLAREALAAA